MEFEEVKPRHYPVNLINKDWNMRKCYYRKGATAFLEKVHAMNVKDDDVWVITRPKSGTTWMQELVWLVLNNFDFVAAKSDNVLTRSPFLEFNYALNEELETALEPIENLKSPRLIKSHLPLPLLPKQLWEKKPKTIYVYRDPKDALVSEYYHMRNIGIAINKTVEEYLNDHIEEISPQILPFAHVSEFYALRKEPWVFYTSYDLMKRNLGEVIQDICKFLNKSVNKTQLQAMLHHLSFEEMKKNPKTNHGDEFSQLRQKLKLPYEPHNFIRRGKVGGYKNELSDDFIAKVNNWIDQELSVYNLSLNELLLLDDA